MQASDEILRAKLNGETARLAWPELQRHFARGVVIRVAPDLDLVEVAVAVAQDRRAEVETWMAQGRVARASSEDAIAWNERRRELWAVVAAPWVLVQEPLSSSDL
ncbi:MAG: DUF2288 domain-containing protein [Betaproteobacteria bacterium]|nr:DUF2288 domain-containing protein [Betaproteobacteria bacterium]